MELSAIAETTVEMWVLIDAKLIARSQDKIDPIIKAKLLDEAMSLYMTHIINEAKGTGKPAEQHQEARSASQKQLDYISDLGGDPSRCLTAAEASDEITRLRKK